VKELLKKEKVYKKGKKTVLLYSSETENYITII
jgi:hypothetical protein